MEFDIDDDGTVRVDGLREAGYLVAANLTDIPGVTITSESLLFADADPESRTHAGATNTLTAVHNGIEHQIIEVATAKDLALPSLNAYAQQPTSRRAIVTLAPIAGSETTEITLAAVESRFTQGVFIAVCPFD